MKTALWLFILGLAVACTGCWAAAHVLMESWQRRFAGMPLHSFTQLVLFPHGWLLFCPTPWCVYATVLTFRKEVTPGATLVFLGTILIAMSAIVSAVVFAALLPYVALIDVL